MGELASTLDALAVDDLPAMFGPQLLERLGELLKAENRLAAEVARTVRQCEVAGAPEFDGKKTMASWLRGHARFSAHAAAELVATGRAMEQLPAVAAAFADGAVTAAQAGVIAWIARPEELARADAQDVDLAAVDQAMATVATTQSHEQLVAVVRHYRQALDPDGAEPDPTEGRRLSLIKHADGALGIRGELDAVGGEKLQAALEAILQAGRGKGDTRTRAQQLADSLVQLTDNALASGVLPINRTVRPHVVITVDGDDLADPDHHMGAAATGFGDLLSAATARGLACDAQITRLVIDPDGLPLDVGRTQRVVPPHLRRAVEHRDKNCVFAGCVAPHYWCDVHHLLEWILGGATSLENSALLCERHHTKVHHGFRVERDPGGRWRTWRPDGTEIVLN
ncbi:HNH endonuclease signature motif containing protein [Petropleomorpha daqingensis]|uniref:HNH nuclease domain-containing protein n=1 Tax=Petropleomorpha daqingensis TaxID=2026353 RepID=A0A853C9B7_9ACTN|nr:hypothetical protein [Petropleomorpha daqingensis]